MKELSDSNGKLQQEEHQRKSLEVSYKQNASRLEVRPFQMRQVFALARAAVSPEPRPRATALLKRPRRLQICGEAKECRCYEGSGRRSEPSPQERCGKWVLQSGGLLTLEAGMFEPLCFVQAANFLIDTQISLSCLFMAESAAL